MTTPNHQEVVQEVAASLFAHVDALESREAELEAAIEHGGASSDALAELQRVRLELTFFLETLEDMGAFTPVEGSRISG
jgi:exonuclease VII small subunit